MVQIRHMVEELVESGLASERNTRQLLEANGRVNAIMGRFKVR
jgi:methyl-accepting chemotaxis protein